MALRTGDQYKEGQAKIKEGLKSSFSLLSKNEADRSSLNEGEDYRRGLSRI